MPIVTRSRRLPTFEAIDANISERHDEHGHRGLRVLGKDGKDGKGGRVVLLPSPPPGHRLPIKPSEAESLGRSR
jgi:hypothetical protein